MDNLKGNLMNSLTKNVTVTYGEKDEPIPEFTCPVGVDESLLKSVAFQPGENPSKLLIREAANAVDLVGRFESGNIEFVDFAPSSQVSSEKLLRVTLKHGDKGNVAVIHAPCFDNQVLRYG